MLFEHTMLVPLIAYATLGLVIIIIIWMIRLKKRIRKLFRGKKDASLDDMLLTLHRDVEELVKEKEHIKKQLTLLETGLRTSIQKIGVVRFNPFRGTSGSNQSFALALLDEKDDGVVLSTLYSRERVSTFAKPIKNRESQYELTPEEREAISKATTRTHQE